MAANEQPDGILLDLLRYMLNIATVVGGLALFGVLFFLMITRANPQSGIPGGEGEATQTQAATPAEPSAGEAPGVPTASPELIAMGEELFQSQGCTACHAIEGVSQGQVGPELTNIGAVAGEQAREAGVSDAATYLRESIVAPNDYIVPDCPTGPCTPGVMPADFGRSLTDEQINALVQYLLAQTGGG